MRLRPDVAVRRYQTLALDCAAPDSVDLQFRDYAIEVAAGTASRSAILRKGWGIPMLAAGDFAFATDSTTCTRAAKAHAVELKADTLSPAKVVVLKAGATRYVVFNGTLRGEHFLYFVFDTAFHHVITIAS